MDPFPFVGPGSMKVQIWHEAEVGLVDGSH